MFPECVRVKASLCLVADGSISRDSGNLEAKVELECYSLFQENCPFTFTFFIPNVLD